MSNFNALKVKTQIVEQLKGKYVYLIVDESTSNGLQVVNFLIGELSPDGPSPAHLLASKEISNTKAETMTAFIDVNFST
jgi:hypothetical protein